MAVLQDTYIGFAEESTYGTFVPPTNFLEFASEGIEGKYDRIEAEGIRAGNVVQRSDRWAVNPKGAEGPLKVELMDVGFDIILKHMFGTIAAGAPTGGFTTYTATLGDLKGKSLSVKSGVVDNTGAINPFDFSGGKIKSWEISNSVDGVLQLNLDMDFAKEATGGASATPSYAAFATQIFTFAGGFVQIGGVEFAVMDVSLKGDNALKTDRYALRSGGLATVKREPLVEGLRVFTFDLKGEFESMTHYNRVKSATTAGAQATLSFQWDTPQGGQLLITVPVARFDAGAPNSDGAKVIEQPLSGKILYDGTTTPLTVAYKAKSS